MLNERGLSLMEVIVSVLILSMIISVGSALFFSVHSLSGNSRERSSYDHMVTLTTNSINREMADAVSVSVTSTNPYQLCFQKFKLPDDAGPTFEMLQYTPSGKSLDLYKFPSGSSGCSTGTPDKLLALSSAVTGLSATYNGSPLIGALSNGEAFNLSITFEKKFRTGNGGTNLESETIPMVIKLF